MSSVRCSVTQPTITAEAQPELPRLEYEAKSVFLSVAAARSRRFTTSGAR